LKVAIIGLGYVGQSLALLLAQHHDVTALDIDPARVARLNARLPTVDDADVAQFLAERPLRLRATTDKADAYAGALMMSATRCCAPSRWWPALRLRQQAGLFAGHGGPG
jgi:UDP-glucose 6-dehydrogenase